MSKVSLREVRITFQGHNVLQQDCNLHTTVHVLSTKPGKPCTVFHIDSAAVAQYSYMEAFSLLFSKSTETLRKFCLQKLIQEHIKFYPIFDKK
jgi:hypothetical protein